MLQVVKLHKAYGGHQVLNGVSFTVSSGTVHVLRGDNGAGKSTLVRCVVGAEVPDAGEVTLAGERLRVGDTSHSRAAGLEMIYQELCLGNQHTVADNIFLGSELVRSGGILDRPAMYERANQLLQGMGIETIASDRIVGTLSGGQRQAVAIARALVRSPKVIIMDEPTAALGVKERAIVVQLIRRLKSQGLGILLISHSIDEINQVADSVMMLERGNLERS